MKGLLIWLLGLTVASAQQFTYYMYPWDTLNFTTSCFNAINTTLTSCSSVLGSYTRMDGVVDLMPDDALELLCTDECASEIASLRSTIEAACTDTIDIMVYNNIAYPATFMLDTLSYTYNISCYTDATTGTYCDLLIAEWQNETNSTEYYCEDCMLGPMSLQLASPIGYDDEWAETFASLTSSCSATGYAYTSPAAYALNTSISVSTSTATSTTATATQTCVSTYTMQVNDTCTSISQSQNVSTYNLIMANNWNILCTDVPDVGGDVCIPEGCNATSLYFGWSCNAMASEWGANLAQVLAWNPIFSSACDNLYLFIDWMICSGPPGGWYNATTRTATATLAAVPTDAMTSSNQYCAEWYLITSGDDCATICSNSGITLADFYFLNPEVNDNCTNLWLGYAYCVEAVGNIATYSGYSATTTIASTSFTRPTTTTTTWAAGPTYTNPVAPGTETDCVVYKDYYSNTSNPIVNWGFTIDRLEALGLDLNSCSFYTNTNATLSDILDWNPSLNSTDCRFEEGYSYCVLQSYNTTSSDNSTDGYCVDVDSSWIVPGTASNCDCYIAITGSWNSSFTCENIELGEISISEAELIALNPWIGDGDCTTGLFVNLTYNASRAVCIGSPSYTYSSGATGSTFTSSYFWTPTSTAPNSVSATITSSATTTTTSSSASETATFPLEPGYISTCDQWYDVQSGDSCWSISQAYGISLDTFYDWNPDVGSSCEALWLGYGVCVGVSSTSSSS